MVDFAKFWLPIIGGGIFFGWGISAYYSGSKVLGIWLLFATAVSLLLLVAIDWQDRVSKEGTTTGTSTAEIAAARAYIAVDDFTAENVHEGGTPRFLATVRNKGQTPARNVRFFSAVMILPNPFPDTLQTFNVTAGGEVPITLDKDTSIRGTKKWPTPLSPEEVAQITSDQFRMTFSGEVRYDDVFGISRVTRFCIGLDSARLKEIIAQRPPNGAITVQGFGLWHYCPRFNDAT